MLRQETDETAPLPAAQVRVTPEELAAAISRLEARKDASQRHAEGTVAIGEVVQQLGLDATPEEVLAEVRAGRATTPKNRTMFWNRLWVLSSIGMIFLGFAAGLSDWSSGAGRTGADTTQTATPVPVTASPPSRILLDPNLLVGDASGKLVMFSEVGDNQPVHCCYLGGKFLERTNGNAYWTLIKHGGKVYVRGRMPKMSPKVLARVGADVISPDNYNGLPPDFNGFPVQVTLALNGFTVSDNSNCQPTGDCYAQFHAQSIHLDKYAYEKW